jgi:hypothetical protein
MPRGRTPRKFYSRARPSSGGRVYLLWAEGTQIFKLGFTDRTVNQRARMIEFNSPLPLRIVGDIPGTMRDERSMHAMLARFREHGEWFRLPEDVLWQVLRWFGLSAGQGAIS